MMDYERAIWSAMDTVIPTVERRGCSFHFIQALIRRIQQEGLARAYVEDSGSREVLKQLLALCYLPADWIKTLFPQLEKKCTTRNLVAFAVYMRTTWIESTMWPPSKWSVYNLSVRTNNHLEGWHREFNDLTRRKTPFYLLIQKMHEVSRTLDLQVYLLMDGLLTQRLHTKYAAVNKALHTVWIQFSSGAIGPLDLLKKCATLYSPTTIQINH